ncbi:MAG: DNA replication and repair protein RecF, partial [Bacteroidales bacterium]|nr:DNA replication and repair protein RecF [Bacteroidales bacterium]
CDKKAYKSFAEHIGKIPLVIITPSDQSLIVGGSELRRKFVDGVISQTDKDYLQHLLQYQRCVEQRNRLLKQFYEDRVFDEASLQVWDDQLVLHGTSILLRRRSFIAEFIPIFADYFHDIAGQSEQPTLQYVSKLEGDDVATLFADKLVEARQRDKYAQYTTVGPHRDDIELMVDGMLVRRFGSQGQQKTFLLALKLAQFEYIFRQRGVKPILLLDDIFDKLDMLRVKQLIHLVGSDRFGQVLLSDTQPGRVQAIFDEMPSVDHRIFNVVKGTIARG